MSANKPTDLAKMKDHYGLALEEIKLEQNIKNMSVVLNNMINDGNVDYLRNEMASQQRQLRSLKKLRE
jgi:hypothetical protein